MDYYFPHTTARATQKELMDFLAEALIGRKHALIHAPTGIGKCVSGNTRILTNEGLVKIEDAYSQNVKINSLDDKLQVTLHNGIIISKEKNALYKLKSKTGREVEATSDHKLLTITNGRLVWKELKDLKQGEFIACARKLNIIEGEPVLRIKDITNLPKNIQNNFAFNITNGFGLILKEHLVKNKKTIKELSKETRIDRKNISTIIRKNKTISYSDYQKLSKLIKIDENSIITEVGTKNRLSTINVNFNEDFCYFLGLIIGDGHINNDNRNDIDISNIDEEILEFCKKFVAPRKLLKAHGDDCTYTVSYKALAYLLFLLGIPAGKKSHIVSIPAVFFKNKVLLKRVVSGIYDSDGHASQAGTEITTKSENLKDCLLQALLVFDVYPIIKLKKVKYKGKILEYHRLYTCDAHNNKKFYENIGFRLKRKQEALKATTIKKSNSNIDIIPEIGQLIKGTGKNVSVAYSRDHNYRIYESYIYNFRNPTRDGLQKMVAYLNSTKKLKSDNTLRLLSNSNIFWDEVTDVAYSREDYVYDATVPETHNFIGNGIILHNTAASLAPAIAYALRANKTVFFVTGKHTQHAIAIATAKKIKETYNLSLNVADFIGKKWMCLQTGVAEMENNEFNEYCREHIKNSTCTYYENLKTRGSQSVATKRALETLQGNILAVDKVMDLAQAEHICPYELTAYHASKAQLIIADYYHVMSPHIQDALFKKIEKDIGNTVIIFDEAHNTPDRARDLLTSTTTTQTIEYAAREVRQLGYEDMARIVEKIIPIFEQLALKIPLQTPEALLLKDDLISEIKKLQDYDQLANDLVHVGEQILESKKRSSAHNLGTFLLAWNGPDEAYTRIILRAFTKKGRPNITLTYRCLDPSLIIKPLADQAQLVFMSGTLSPINTFKDILGINAVVKELPDPFPQENRLNLIVPEITTKFTHRDESMFKKIAGYCAALTNAIPGNSVIFFPSYQLRDTVLPYFQKLSDKTILTEQQSMHKHERDALLETFKRYKETGAVLLGVSNANFGEGVDLPGDYLKGVIIVGLPLAKPDLETQELIRYYDTRFGAGWEYGYVFPALTKTLQNAGRCIRSDTDRGVIIFLDDRYNLPQYKKFFPKEWHMQTLQDPIRAVKDFFSKKAE